MSKKMPVLFVGHGSPMNAILDNSCNQTWRKIGEKLPKPKAILAISAHWYTKGTYTQTEEQPRQIYDFYGFPKELYEVHYPAKGDLNLAERVIELMGLRVQIHNGWGIDHGTWSVVSNLFPKADVPIVQMSIDQGLSMAECYEIGKCLKELRNEGYMILGSGNVVHSFQYVNFNMSDGYPWAEAFDDYIHDAILDGSYDKVVHYEKEGPEYHKAFQTLEHFAPLIYILGATDAQEPVTVFNRGCEMGSMSMTSYLFGHPLK